MTSTSLSGTTPNAPMTTLTPITSSPTFTVWDQRGEDHLITITDLPVGNWYLSQNQTSRFQTAAITLNSWELPSELRIVDLYSDTVLAGRTLETGEFLMPSPQRDAVFYTGQYGTNTNNQPVLTVRSFGYGLDASNAGLSLAQAPSTELVLNTPISGSIVDYLPSATGGYLISSNWTSTQGEVRTLYAIQNGTVVESPIALPDAEWIGSVLLAEGTLWLQASGAYEEVYYRLSSTGWVQVEQQQYWDVWDKVLALDSVVRGDGFTLDLLPLIPVGASMWLDEGDVTSLANGRVLVRTEVEPVGNELGYEQWLVYDPLSDTVVANKAFSSGSGVALRGVFGLDDGAIYVQQIHLTLENGDITGQGDPAVTLYRIALNQVESVLAAATNVETLTTAVPGVVAVGSFTAAQLTGFNTVPDGSVATVQGYVPAGALATGLKGRDVAVLVSGHYTFESDEEVPYLVGVPAPGSTVQPWRVALPPGELEDLILEPGLGIFLLNWSWDGYDETAYKLDPASGNFSEIPLDIFYSIQNGEVPAGVQVLEGTSGNDTIVSSGLAGTAALITSGDGDDTIVAGAAGEVIGTGLGADRIKYVAQAQLDGDQIDGGWEQGTRDAVVLAPTSAGQTFDLSVADIRHIDDIRIGSDVANLSIVVNGVTTETADFNMDGQGGDIRIAARLDATGTDPMQNGVNVNAREMWGGQSLFFEGRGYTEDNGVTWKAGFAGSDTVLGGDGNDSLHGGAGDDSLDGGYGNDTLAGGGGNDQLSGGSGLADIAAYGNVASQYRIEDLDNGTWQVTDLDTSNGDEGTDTLTGIERLSFAGTVRLLETSSATVQVWDQRGEQHSILIDDLPVGDWSLELSKSSRFQTAAVMLQERYQEQMPELRIVDLYSDKVLAGRTLQAGEFLMQSPQREAIFHTGQLSFTDGDQPVLTVRSFGYGLDASAASLTQALSTTALVLDTSPSASFVHYLPGTTGGYLIGREWVHMLGNVWTLYTIQNGTVVESPIELPQADWIGSAFLAEGTLWLQTHDETTGQAHYRLNNGSWEPVGEQQYWDVQDSVQASESVIRGNGYTLDLLPLIAPGASVWLDEEDLTSLANGRILVRAEVEPLDNELGYEQWLVYDTVNKTVVANKAFSSGSGIGLRSTYDVEAGTIYFQQVNVTLDAEGNIASQGSPAVTLYRIAHDQVETALLAAAGLQTLTTAVPGVMEVGSFTATQLTGLDTVTPGSVVAVPAYVSAGLLETGLRGGDVAVLVSEHYSFETDKEVAFLVGVPATGSTAQPWRVPVPPGEIDGLILEPGLGLFLLIQDQKDYSETAYKLDPGSGNLSAIPVDVFYAIQNGDVPAAVQVLEGTPGNDTIVSSGTAEEDVLITSGAGNDTIVGSAAEEVIGTGLGIDRIRYVDPAYLLGDRIDAGKEQGTWDGLVLAPTVGQTFDLGVAEIRHIDEIRIGSDVANLSIVLGAAIAETADFNNDGKGGDIRIAVRLGTEGTLPMTHGIHVDASSMTAGQALTLNGMGYTLDQGQTWLAGFLGDDTVFGGAGNDILQGGAGNDQLHGGGGLGDIAGYGNVASEYQVVDLGNGTWRVTDLDTTNGNEGIDTLTGIERLRFADKTQLLGASSLTVQVWDLRGEQHSILIEDLPASDYWYLSISEKSRFQTAAVILEDVYKGPELRIVDLYSGTVLAGRSLNPDEFLMQSPQREAIFHTGQFGTNASNQQVLFVRSFGYGIDATASSLTQPLNTTELVLQEPLSGFLVHYLPSATVGYLIASEWRQTQSGEWTEMWLLYTIQNNTVVESPIALPDVNWINSALLAEGTLWLQTHSETGQGYYRLNGNTWETIGAQQFWEVRDAVQASGTVVRGDGFAFDMLSLIPTGASVWLDEEDVTRLANGRILVRAEVEPQDDALGYEQWLVLDPTALQPVVTNKVFSKGSGVGLRSIHDVEDGAIYFQQIHVTLDAEGGIASQGSPAVTLYRIAASDVDSVLAAATGLDTLTAAVPGVVAVGSFTAAQLAGLATVPDGSVVVAKSYVSAGLLTTGLQGRDVAVLVSEHYTFETDRGSVYLVGVPASGSLAQPWRVQLPPGEFEDLILEPTLGLFVLTWDPVSGSDIAYKLDPASGNLSAIPVDVFYAIQNGDVPAAVQVLEGTPGNDSIVSDGTAEDVLITSGNGNDTILGSAAEEVIGTGLGVDRIRYVDAAHLLGDQIDAGKEQGTWDGLVLAPTVGQTFDLGVAEIRHIDEIRIGSDVADLSIVLGAAIAETADFNNDGKGGDIRIAVRLGTEGTLPMTHGIHVDASSMTAGQALTLNGMGYTLDQGQTWLAGFLGDDTVFGGAGNDNLHGGAGNDDLDGGLGNDILQGGVGDDWLSGTGGNDSLYGGEGDDTLQAWQGVQWLDGGAGADMLEANGASQITMTGGDGVDTFLVYAQQYWTLSQTTPYLTQGDGGYTDVPAQPVLITDFTAGVGGDQLALEALLHGAAYGWQWDDDPFEAGYLSFVQDGADTLLYFDADAAGTDLESVLMARLQNVDAGLLLPENVTPSYGNTSPQLQPPVSIVYVDTSADDSFSVVQGYLQASDADGDVLGFGITGGTLGLDGWWTKSGEFGILRLDSTTGDYSFTPNDAAIEALSADDQDSFSVFVSDGSSETYATLVLGLEGANDVPTGTVSLDGQAIVGQTLTASNTLQDRDGMGQVSYRWLADGVQIGAATTSTYTLTPAEFGKVITVQALYSDQGGTSEQVFSAASSAVLADAPSTSSLSGHVYHWKTHALLSDVALKLSPGAAAVDPGAPLPLFELRTPSLNAAGDLQAELWVNLAQAVGSLDLELRFDPAFAASFTAASMATGSPLEGWTLIDNYASGSLVLGGFSENELSGSVKLGQFAFDLPVGTTQAQIQLLAGEAGSVDTDDLQTLQPYVVMATGGDGAYGFDNLAMGQYGLTASRTLTTLETGSVINSADALAALKIAVGRNPNADPDGTGPQLAPVVSPYQFIAADVNQDGKVNSADALAILKMAVKRSDAPAREWLFVSEEEDFWNETAGAFTTTRTAVSWDRGEKLLDAPDIDSLNLVAVLKGDVNGNWAAPVGSQVLADSYFQELHTAGVGPLAQWGVLPV